MAEELPVPGAPADSAEPQPAAPETDVEVQTASEAEAEPVVEADEDELTPEELEELRASEVAFSWEASEYVHHHKGPLWYVVLFGILLVLTVASALLHYWLEIVAFLAMGGAILVYARRPPRTLLYELTPTGITADGREFPFSEFRSFGVLSDIEWHTIDLEPTKRFSPRMAILFEDGDFDAIVGHLELHLPRVDRDPDLVERLTRLIRF